MPATSDVIKAAGGGGGFLRDSMTRVTFEGSVGSPDTDAITSSHFNQNDPIIIKEPIEFSRVRLPNGSTAGDFINIMVDQTSEIVRFEQFTPLTDGTHPLVLALSPGASGYMWWDGIEWWWDGTGEIWWPVMKNTPGNYISFSGAAANNNEGCGAYFEDATIGPGVVDVRGGVSGSPDFLQATVIPINVDGSLGTPGTTVTHSEANGSYQPGVRALSDNIFLVCFYESTTNHTRLIVLTRTAGSSTLTFGTSSSIIVSGSVKTTDIEIIPFRGDATKFLIVHGDHVIDSSRYPEVAYCTIAGTGSSAAITRNTGVTFTSTNTDTAARGVCMEDPSTDGTFWLFKGDDDGGANTRPHITKFTISGTTPTVGGQWQALYHTAHGSDGVSYDFKDGRTFYTNAEAYMTFELDLSSGFPVTKGSSYDRYNQGNMQAANRRPYNQLASNAGHLGGVSFRRPSLLEATATAIRYTRNYFRDGLAATFPAGSTTTVNHSSGFDVITLAANLRVPLPQETGASSYFGDSRYDICTGSVHQVHSGTENNGLMITCSCDEDLDSAFILHCYEVATASRYKNDLSVKGT